MLTASPIAALAAAGAAVGAAAAIPTASIEIVFMDR